MPALTEFEAERKRIDEQHAYAASVRPLYFVFRSQWDRNAIPTAPKSDRARLPFLLGIDRARRERTLVELDAAYDRDVSRFYVRCGWTQARIAEVVGKSQQMVSYLLTFGRFLSFTTGSGKSAKPPKNLTERKFREYFERTDRNQNERRAGELLAEMKERCELQKQTDGRPRKKVSQDATLINAESPKTCEDLGVTRDDVSRWQTQATMPAGIPAGEKFSPLSFSGFVVQQPAGQTPSTRERRSDR